jgi:glycosyltransferase involved in cell wall biosynthesis
MTRQRIVFDLSDLVNFVCGRSQPSGIQRVQIDVCRRLKNMPNFEVLPVYFVESLGRYVSIDADRLLTPDREYAKSLRCFDPPSWRKLLLWFDRFRVLEPRRGDVVFVVGAGWSSPHRTPYLAEMAKLHGVLVIWIMYDLIPLTHPEFTIDQNVRAFRVWIDAALNIPGRFLCISRFTKDELVKHAAAAGYSVDAVAVPLAHEFSPVVPTVRDRFHYLKNERFVLSVGTLEIRKNHLSLVRLWERLYFEMGEAQPMLVLAGARGWAIDRLAAYLRATGNVYGQVSVIFDASDAELAWLYQHCAFTVYPSVHEGWGLPVGESLWFGKPCICYRHSSLPEVGGNHAIYCELDDRGSLERAVRTALAGNFHVRPPARSELRTWDAVTADIIRASPTVRAE